MFSSISLLLPIAIVPLPPVLPLHLMTIQCFQTLPNTPGRPNTVPSWEPLPQRQFSQISFRNKAEERKGIAFKTQQQTEKSNFFSSESNFFPSYHPHFWNNPTGALSNTVGENINLPEQQSGHQYIASIYDHALWPNNSTSRNITVASFITAWKFKESECTI